MLKGTKTIFRNVFVRELYDIRVPGMAHWYQSMQKLGCHFHYVSNSPWELWPVVRSFLVMAGFPGGSCTLKEYGGASSALAKLWEEPGQRKRANVEAILKEFPESQCVPGRDFHSSSSSHTGDPADSSSSAIRASKTSSCTARSPPSTRETSSPSSSATSRLPSRLSGPTRLSLTLPTSQLDEPTPSRPRPPSPRLHRLRLLRPNSDGGIRSRHPTSRVLSMKKRRASRLSMAQRTARSARCPICPVSGMVHTSGRSLCEGAAGVTSRSRRVRLSSAKGGETRASQARRLGLGWAAARARPRSTSSARLPPLAPRLPPACPLPRQRRRLRGPNSPTHSR